MIAHAPASTPNNRDLSRLTCNTRTVPAILAEALAAHCSIPRATPWRTPLESPSALEVALAAIRIELMRQIEFYRTAVRQVLIVKIQLGFVSMLFWVFADVSDRQLSFDGRLRKVAAPEFGRILPVSDETLPAIDQPA